MITTMVPEKIQTNSEHLDIRRGPGRGQGGSVGKIDRRKKPGLFCSSKGYRKKNCHYIGRPEYVRINVVKRPSVGGNDDDPP